MQGRLSPRVDGKIQAFPKNNWKNEFKLAKEIGYSSIEWILENPLVENPLLSKDGLFQIKDVIAESNIKIDFICADIFMEEPILDNTNSKTQAKELLEKIFNQSKKIGAKYIEIPFVDNSSIRNRNHEYLISFFNSMEKSLIEQDLFINLETDLKPNDFKKLLDKLNPRIGANYDIGNSASLGYNYTEELKLYGNRINNVHIKDRILGGSTVEFGTGNADIESVLHILSSVNYDKGVIIQGARGRNDIETAKAQFLYTKKIIDYLSYDK